MCLVIFGRWLDSICMHYIMYLPIKHLTLTNYNNNRTIIENNN